MEKRERERDKACDVRNELRLRPFKCGMFASSDSFRTNWPRVYVDRNGENVLHSALPVQTVLEADCS